MDEDKLNKRYHIVTTISEDEYNNKIKEMSNFFKTESVYERNKELCNREFLVCLKKTFVIVNNGKLLPGFLVKSKIEVTKETHPELFI